MYLCVQNRQFCVAGNGVLGKILCQLFLGRRGGERFRCNYYLEKQNSGEPDKSEVAVPAKMLLSIPL